MKRISYSQIERLPADHPLFLRFMAQLAEEEGYTADEPCFDDEESIDHFNRYVAGDRGKEN